MAFDINQVFLIGRLTRNPEIKVSGDVTICKFGVANNPGKEDKDVSFFNIVTFGKIAENCERYLKKGSQVAISGQLKQNRWEKDGQKYNSVDIIGSNIQFIGSKSSDYEDSSENPPYSKSRTQKSKYDNKKEPVVDDDDDNNGGSYSENEDYDENEDEDIPF